MKLVTTVTHGQQREKSQSSHARGILSSDDTQEGSLRHVEQVQVAISL